MRSLYPRWSPKPDAIVERTQCKNLCFCVFTDGESDDDDENGDVSDVALDKLPRPVNELNCRQSRTFLVKLLRAANGGLNPQVK